RSRGRRMWVLSALPVLALVHVAVLLTIGSRGGLVALIMLARSRAFDTIKDKVSRRAMAITAGASALAVALLALVGIMRGQLVSVERLLNADVADDMRIRALGTIVDMAWRYFPFGTGAGSFAEVYKIYEPDALLYESYLNRAHNDIVETVLTMGLPGVIGVVLLAIVIVRGWWLVLRSGRGQGNAARSSKPWQAEATLGLAIITILATGSVLDYPLRVPSLAGLFVLAAAWYARGFAAQAGTAVSSAGQNNPR
ncbi:MAG: O-antigen ligase family protein, partial [Sphingopyxis sp.]|nr:O-antigen ligase family protein [Sphingopyxis sp.]